MKTFFYLLTLAAFVFSVTMGFAADQGAGPGKVAQDKPAVEKGINCCIKGQCKQLSSEADCTKAGGKVVKECKDCK